MATNLNISENQERVPLRVGGGGLLRSITPDSGSPYYVGARAYVTQTASGAIVTVIDKDGTTTATILNGTNGQNGVSISDISLTGSSGLVDTYTITYSNGDTDTFTVTNGQDGADGNDGYSPTATVTKSGDTATITITDINGTTTATVKDGTQANAFTAEFNVTTYADVKDAYDDDAILICTIDDSGNPMVLQFVYFDVANEIFYFAMPMSYGWYCTQLSNADGWDDGQFFFASTDVATQLADGLMSALDKQKLDGIASGAEVNVQSDWNQSVNTADDYIKNKPTIPTKVSDLSNDSGYITSPNVVYCTCSTAGGTAAKVATIESGSLTSLNEGDQAIVKFTNANSVASPTLQVGTTTAKSIKRYGTTAPSTSAATSWNAGSAVYFVYDGTYWQQIGFLNTTYSEISQANITNGTGSSTGLASGRRVKKAVETFAPIKDVTVDGTSVLSGTTAAIDLSGKANASHTHTKSDITDFPALATVATSGDYDDLIDKPAIHNIPSGGTSGQVLAKDSNDDYDLAWVNQSGGGGGEIVYCTCADSASTVAKTATVVSGTFSSLTTGSQVAVKFTYTNTATNPTLNVAGTGAKGIRRGGTAYVGTNANESWNAGTVVFLLYDGTDWQIVGWLNTTYGGGTGTEIVAGTSALNKVWSPQQINYGIDGMSTATPTASKISKFDSSAHINSDDMSAQDVSDFVDGLNVSGINAVDYIVEQGISGIWTYRKWNSGIAECWSYGSNKTLAVSSAYGNGYYGATQTLTFPSGLFNSAPNSAITLLGGDGLWAGISSNSSTSVTYYPYAIASGNHTFAEAVTAIGTWK